MPEVAEQATPVGLLNGMPWYIKAISYVGFPIAAALGMGYLVFSMLQPHVLDSAQHYEDARRAMEAVAYTNTIMCQNAAATKEDAGKCVPPPKK